jgi:hypothetical protein
MAERRYRIALMDGPLDGYEEVVTTQPPDVFVIGGWRYELDDTEAGEPRRWVYRCAGREPDEGPDAT